MTDDDLRGQINQDKIELANLREHIKGSPDYRKDLIEKCVALTQMIEEMEHTLRLRISHIEEEQRGEVNGGAYA